jgi:hypothetical protein
MPFLRMPKITERNILYLWGLASWWHLIIFSFSCFNCTSTDVCSCLWLQEDLRKIDNWQYINCLNLWVKFLCCNYKDYNIHPLLLQVLQVVRGVAHLFPGTRYLPLRLKLVQMLNELSTCSQIFIPAPSLLFDCLEFREVSQNEQAPKTKVNFSSLLKVCHFCL